MKTIKDAYEELNGDIVNSHYYEGESKLYWNTSSKHYVCVRDAYFKATIHQYICTVKEFNNYKPEATQENEAVNNNREKNMIDWNEAPKEATHHGEFENHECWYQVKGDEVFSWNTGVWHDTCWKPEQLTANNEGNVTFTPRPEAEQENEAVNNNRENNMIDWNEAPKGTTHHGKSGSAEIFYLVDGESVQRFDLGKWRFSLFTSEEIKENTRKKWHFTPRPEAAQESEAVKNPKHYQIIEGYESIEVIACSLTAEQWKGFCLGNILKYRIRAGKKDLLQQDIDKADFYEVLHEKHKYLCRKGK